jgi:UPF0271 protein
MLTIDLNCDLGEGFARYRLVDDNAIMPYISSANIACGFHAGDPAIMEATVLSAKRHHVAIGAHPGLPDREGFGRRAMSMTEGEIYQLTLFQVGALAAFAKAAGTKVLHVKPHGALYNMSASDNKIAMAIAKAVADFDRKLLLFGLSGSCSVTAGSQCGLTVVEEAFADRRYQLDGQLMPRTSQGSVLVEPEQVDTQLLSIVTKQQVCTNNGELIHLDAGSICIHGDTPGAVENARRIHQLLQTNNIVIKAPAYNENV